MTPTAVLAPFQYTSIVWATMLGWLVWRDAPSATTLLGNAIIVGGGLVALWRETGAGDKSAALATRD
jgi:drug/metabolite transporter (DMT)-like permease